MLLHILKDGGQRAPGFNHLLHPDSRTGATAAPPAEPEPQQLHQQNWSSRKPAFCPQTCLKTDFFFKAVLVSGNRSRIRYLDQRLRPHVEKTSGHFVQEHDPLFLLLRPFPPSLAHCPILVAELYLHASASGPGCSRLEGV